MTQSSFEPLLQSSAQRDSQTQVVAGHFPETSTRPPTSRQQFATLWQRVGLFRDVLAVAVAGILVLGLALANSRKSAAPDPATPSIDQLWKQPLELLRPRSH